MKLRAPILKKLLIICLAGGFLAAAALLYLKESDSVTAISFRSAAGEYLNIMGLPGRPDPWAGIEALSSVLYVNNQPQSGVSPHFGEDNKLVVDTAECVRLFDYATGFQMDFPSGTSFDFTLSPQRISAYSEDFQAVISREWSVDTDVTAYIDYYFYRFLLDEGFRAENGVTLLEHVNGDQYKSTTVSLGDLDGHYDTYTYIDIMTGTRYFYHMLFKYDSGATNADALVSRISDSFAYFKPYGEARYDADFHPNLSDGWNTETDALYSALSSSDAVTWGIFTEDVTNTGINETIPAMESKLGNDFDIVLAYVHLNGTFPSDFMELCYDEGRIVELTYQVTACNNEDLYAFSPWLDMYRGTDYAEVRAFAQAAKAFGKPFLFRLNNEMNSDWTSYGGVNNMLDPDIFIENWRRIYRIFEEEGVDNAIWIFNPNDRDCPPNGWNSFAAYYPGNGYVHMIGLTGYNNGTYYSEWNERWREFDTIYGQIAKDYAGVFDAFPWIITEFSTSSIGGDKARWIDGMFGALGDFPQIKAAVWFSYADYDYRNGGEVVARPYWLDETQETLDAFRRGLESQSARE